MSDPNQADLRVLDGFNPSKPLLEFLCRQGVTVVHAVPGRANVIAGQTGIFRTCGTTVETMTLRFPAGILDDKREGSQIIRIRNSYDLRSLPVIRLLFGPGIEKARYLHLFFRRTG